MGAGGLAAAGTLQFSVPGGSRTAGGCCRVLGVNCESFDVIPWKVLVLLTEAPLFCRDLDADALLDFFLIMCDPSPLIP